MHYVKVTSKRDGFRRGGRAWSCAETLAGLNEDAFDAVAAEPTLHVIEISAEEYSVAAGIALAEIKGKGGKNKA